MKDELKLISQLLYHLLCPYLQNCRTLCKREQTSKSWISFENSSAARFFAHAISAGLCCKNTVVKNKKATDKIIHLLLTLSLLWHASSKNCELKFQAVSNLKTSKKARKNHAGCQQLSWLLVGLWRDVLQLAPRVNLGSPRHKVVSPTQPFVLSSRTKRRRRHLHFNYKLEYISLVLFFIAVTEPVIF